MVREWLSEDSREHYASVLGKAGMSVTQPRLNLLQCFVEAGERHFNVDELHRYVQRNDVPLNIPTMYRVLRQLAEAGILLRTRLSHGHTVYELGPRAPHDHLVCQECGRVDDLGSEVLDLARRHIEESSGYSFRDIPAALFGMCVACSRASRGRPREQAESRFRVRSA